MEAHHVQGFLGERAFVADQNTIHVLVMAEGHHHIAETTVLRVYPTLGTEGEGGRVREPAGRTSRERRKNYQAK